MDLVKLVLVLLRHFRFVRSFQQWTAKSVQYCRRSRHNSVFNNCTHSPSQNSLRCGASDRWRCMFRGIYFLHSKIASFDSFILCTIVRLVLHDVLDYFLLSSVHCRSISGGQGSSVSPRHFQATYSTLFLLITRSLCIIPRE